MLLMESVTSRLDLWFLGIPCSCEGLNLSNLIIYGLLIRNSMWWLPRVGLDPSSYTIWLSSWRRSSRCSKRTWKGGAKMCIWISQPHDLSPCWVNQGSRFEGEGPSLLVEEGVCKSEAFANLTCGHCWRPKMPAIFKGLGRGSLKKVALTWGIFTSMWRSSVGGISSRCCMWGICGSRMLQMFFKR